MSFSYSDEGKKKPKPRRITGKTKPENQSYLTESENGENYTDKDAVQKEKEK